ncbi:MAG: hypothetical protein DHS20C08_00960 [Rhodomicrobium sp.]|nr:MAG: hypothetical protein DHS20C08_00960 [Rhodomicrobium sp.]
MTAWETLGIKPTNEEPAIKRAYAAKLKIIRPDEDPEGFQQLREARDEALYLAPFVNDEGEEWQDDDWNCDYEYDEDYSDYEGDEKKPITFELDDICRDKEQGPLETLDISAATSEELEEANRPEAAIKEAELREAESREAATSTFIDMRDHKISVPSQEHCHDKPEEASHQRPQQSEHSNQYINADQCDQPLSEHAPLITGYAPGDTELENEDVQGNENRLSNEDTLTIESVDHELEQLCGPWSKWDIAPWHSFIKEIREQSFQLSNYAEHKILISLSEAIIPLTPRTERERANLTNIFSLLDMEFGWRHNDRHVYNILGDKQAEQLMDYIRDRLSNRDHNQPRVYYDAIGFPMLKEQDFIDYLGKKDSIYQRYYEQCREHGNQYQFSWSWPGFLFCPLWLAHRCNDGMEALIGISYTIALVILIYGYNNNNTLMALTGVTLVAALHILIGIFGKRILISTMATAFTELEMDKKLTAKERLLALKKLGQGGRKAISDLILGNIGIAVILIVILAIFTGG